VNPFGKYCVLMLLALVTTIGSAAQTFTTLANLDTTTGDFPLGPFTQGLDGNFWALTSRGGFQTFFPCDNYGCGMLLKISPGGTLTPVRYFNGQDGWNETGGLVLSPNRDFYGTGVGVFAISPNGTLKTVHTFSGPDGSNPAPGVTLGADGNIYGVTLAGGANGQGTFYKMTSAGTLSTLYSFCAQANCTDGEAPNWQLVQAPNGDFYGTMVNGGTHIFGTIFKITLAGKLTTLHNFCAYKNCADGEDPFGGLVLATDGNFYGTANTGNCPTYCIGLIYRVTSGGTFSILHRFCTQTNCPDGANPVASLIQANDGNLYGVTESGGANGVGTIFQITLAGVLTTLHSFDGTDGSFPAGALFQGTDGIFYGTTSQGGTGVCRGFHGCGTVFSLSMGLPPFISAVPTSGWIGRNVIILGSDLAGASAVTFNGTPATFTVVSASEIHAQVPTGATTGTVQVDTPGGTLASNVVFRVP